MSLARWSDDGVNNRANLLIAGWMCVMLGIGLNSMGVWEAGVILSLSGITLLLLGFIQPADLREMSDVAIAHWIPEDNLLPPDGAGNVMYRVDTTLDPPITTTILCGRCGTTTKVDGPRPIYWICSVCSTCLWDHEEE